jgi:hypothetical protein
VFLKSIVKYFPSPIIAAATTTLMKSVKDDYMNKVDDQLLAIKEMGLALMRSAPKKD